MSTRFRGAVIGVAFCLTLVIGAIMEWNSGVWPSNGSLAVIGVICLLAASAGAWLWRKATSKKRETSSNAQSAADTGGERHINR
jgi:hypothetical protein